VTPLRGTALREAIAAPAEGVGVTVEPGLIERLVADAASEPGILPLLQEALVQLWDTRAGQTLTLVDYQALGDGVRSGLAVALARRADAILQRFNAAQTDIARRILLRLISFGEGRSDTRRQQPRAQLRAAGDNVADFEFVLRTMVDHRLLTVDEDVDGEPRVDLAHEVMISAWPALADWIRSHRVNEQRRRQLEAAAAQWMEHGRGVRGLLDPIELAEAELWQQTESAVQLGQSAQVMALIAASRAAQTKQRRRRGVLAGSVSLLGMVAVVIAAAAFAARDLANKNQELVTQSYVEAGRQFVVDHRYQEAVPYLLAARQSGEDRALLRTLFREAEQHLPVIPALKCETWFRRRVRPSPLPPSLLHSCTINSSAVTSIASARPRLSRNTSSVPSKSKAGGGNAARRLSGVGRFGSLARRRRCPVFVRYPDNVRNPAKRRTASSVISQGWAWRGACSVCAHARRSFAHPDRPVAKGEHRERDDRRDSCGCVSAARDTSLTPPPTRTG
jgi:hypothetical protein